MNRAKAAWELVKADRTTEAGQSPGVGMVQDVAVKSYDAFSGIGPAITGIISNNEYTVIRRDSPIAATCEAVRSTLKARWFPKGNPLNLGAKVVTGLMEGTDGLIQDVLHAGGSQNGYVVHTAA